MQDRTTPIVVGDELKVEYDGYLAQQGAEAIFLHYGYGTQEWNSVQDIAMDKSRDGIWRATIQADDMGPLNFCFHDENDNWDNNHGEDWHYTIHGDAARWF